MSNIAEFPCYTTRENMVTNNTMLFLRKLHAHKPAYFQLLLEGLFDESDILVGPQFLQQFFEGDSIPDGAIRQSDLEIRIETKLGNSFDQDQIRRHMDIGGGKHPILVMLSIGEPEVSHQKELSLMLDERGVRHCFLTFSKLADAVSELLQDYELELLELVGGFYEFLDKANLVDRREVTLRAVCSGTTSQDNIKHRAYATYASRGYRAHRYLGLYWEKSVRRIGRILDIVAVQLDIAGKWQMRSVHTDELSEESKKSINEIMLAHIGGTFYPNADFTIPHNIFLVDKFIETDFNKSTKHPIQSTKYFYLNEILDTVPHCTQELASRLQEQSWE